MFGYIDPGQRATAVAREELLKKEVMRGAMYLARD